MRAQWAAAVQAAIPVMAAQEGRRVQVLQVPVAPEEAAETGIDAVMAAAVLEYLAKDLAEAAAAMAAAAAAAATMVLLTTAEITVPAAARQKMTHRAEAATAATELLEYSGVKADHSRAQTLIKDLARL
jgi:hypothetical protein